MYRPGLSSGDDRKAAKPYMAANRQVGVQALNLFAQLCTSRRVNPRLPLHLPLCAILVKNLRRRVALPSSCDRAA
jgi:hypothetical protein